MTGLVDNPDIIFEDQLKRLKKHYIEKGHKDIEKTVERLNLVFQQKNKYKKFGLVLFSFALYQGQIDDI